MLSSASLVAASSHDGICMASKRQTVRTRQLPSARLVLAGRMEARRRACRAWWRDPMALAAVLALLRVLALAALLMPPPLAMDVARVAHVCLATLQRLTSSKLVERLDVLHRLRGAAAWRLPVQRLDEHRAARQHPVRATHVGTRRTTVNPLGAGEVIWELMRGALRSKTNAGETVAF